MRVKILQRLESSDDIIVPTDQVEDVIKSLLRVSGVITARRKTTVGDSSVVTVVAKYAKGDADLHDDIAKGFFDLGYAEPT